MKKLALWAFGIFLVFFVVRSPVAAATVTKAIGSGLTGLAIGFGDFFTKLFS